MRIGVGGGGGAEMCGGRCAAEGACVWVWEGANTLKRGRGMLRRRRAYGCGRAKVRSNVGEGAEMCGGRCAAEGRFLSRNKGKVGGDGRTAIDKMARRCAAVGA